MILREHSLTYVSGLIDSIPGRATFRPNLAALHIPVKPQKVSPKYNIHCKLFPFTLRSEGVFFIFFLPLPPPIIVNLMAKYRLRNGKFACKKNVNADFVVV